MADRGWHGLLLPILLLAAGLLPLAVRHAAPRTPPSHALIEGPAPSLPPGSAAFDADSDGLPDVVILIFATAIVVPLRTRRHHVRRGLAVLTGRLITPQPPPPRRTG
ncbi:MAG TPA: hypothetical protein VH916_12210 [Dehalococcoidia bacterium]